MASRRKDVVEGTQNWKSITTAVEKVLEGA
jgi:hypothetical protein